MHKQQCVIPTGATRFSLSRRIVARRAAKRRNLSSTPEFGLGKNRGVALQIREYDEGDLDALQAIHAAQGFPYEFPDLQNPLFLTRLVLAGDESDPVEGKGIAGAALLRLTAEAYLLLDPRRGTPKERWQWLLGLHEAARRQAWERGLEDVHAWLPPEIAAKFGRRLTRLGWIRDDEWTPYCKRLK